MARKSLSEIEASKPAWIRTIESPTEENIQTLSKGELVWVASWFAGGEEPTETPEQHTGSVPKPLLRNMVEILGNSDDLEEGFIADESDEDESGGNDQENLESLTREQLEEQASTAGVENPEEFDNKQAIIDALN